MLPQSWPKGSRNDGTLAALAMQVIASASTPGGEHSPDGSGSYGAWNLWPWRIFDGGSRTSSLVESAVLVKACASDSGMSIARLEPEPRFAFRLG